MNKSYEKKLLTTLTKASKNEKMLKDFLGEILTPKEYAEIVRRFEILSRLTLGEAQRVIADDLGVGIATVTRGSHVLAGNNTAFTKLTGKSK